MPLPADPAPLSRTLAREEIYARLRDWIVAGVLRPEETLRDHEIAEQLGVSRTPVREALRRLEDEGFVETALNRWTRVAPLDLARVADLYPLIEALDALALDTAAPRLTAAHLGRLERANAALSRGLDRRDAEAALAADDAFHGVWVEQAGNRELRAVLDQLKIKARRAEVAYFDVEARARHSLGEHEALMQALRAGQWGEAVEALRQNWRGSLERLRARQPRT